MRNRDTEREKRKPVHADRETSEGTEGRGYGDSLIGPIYHRRGTEGSGQREKTEEKVGLSCGFQRYRFVHLSKSVLFCFFVFCFTSVVSAVSEKRKKDTGVRRVLPVSVSDTVRAKIAVSVQHC